MAQNNSQQGSGCHFEYWFDVRGDVHILDPSSTKTQKPQPKAGRLNTWQEKDLSSKFKCCFIVWFVCFWWCDSNLYAFSKSTIHTTVYVLHMHRKTSNDCVCYSLNNSNMLFLQLFLTAKQPYCKILGGNQV